MGRLMLLKSKVTVERDGKTHIVEAQEYPPIPSDMKPDQVDMLELMYHNNRKLTGFLVKNSPRPDLVGNTHARILGNALAMSAEVGEFINETEFKWWGRGVDGIDKKKAALELIDLLHFMFNEFELLGLAAEDICELYLEKNAENWERFAKKKGWGEANK